MVSLSTRAAAEEEKGHSWFAAMFECISAPSERRYGKQVRSRLMGEVEGHVLEIGAGTGHSFPYYTQKAQVVGTEPDPFMLKRARGRLEELGLANIELRQTPAEGLPFEDASFDHVVSSLVLCSVRDPARALAEARRVLRPGGTFRFWEHIRNDESRFWGAVQDVIAPAWRWFGAGCNPNRRTRQAIEQAGFRIEWLDSAKMAFGAPGIYGVAVREAW